MFELDSFFEQDKVKNELKEILGKYHKFTFDLEENDKNTLSILLENQNLINQIGNQFKDDSNFTKCSIRLAAAMYSNLMKLNICHFMPMLGPTQRYLVDFVAATRRMKVAWESEKFKDADYLLLFSMELYKDVFDEIFEDLNYCSQRVVIKGNWKDETELFLDHLSCNYNPKPIPEWIITNSNVAEALLGNSFNVFELSIVAKNMGTLVLKNYEIPVIVNSSLDKDMILFGRKDAYVHAGYIPFSRLPAVISPGEFNPKSGILIRYGKRLLNNNCLYKMTQMD